MRGTPNTPHRLTLAPEFRRVNQGILAAMAVMTL
jgi:hypothetical protein